MSDIAIRVESLSKQYYLGQARPRYRTIRETITNILANPIRRLKNPGPETIWALKDVSFDVRRGEVIGIIGRNGAGKSTLLKVLSRITEPTVGRAEIHGRVGSLLEVGTGFHPELTGRENIYLNGAILGMKRAEVERKFDEIVAFAEMERFLDTPVKHYSSGMYVRLAFAVAAHLEPDILLVDEVLAVGDAAFQKKCLGKMGDVVKGGRTILFVSHNMGAVNQLCERGLWIDHGRIAKTGPIQDVIQGYLNTSASATGVWVNCLIYEAEPKVKLLSASVMMEGGVQTGVVRFDEEFRLEVYYEVLAPIRSWLLLFRVNDSFGTPVFTSWDIDTASHEEVTKIGKYRAICRVPARVLRPGLYSATLLAHASKIGVLDHQENAFHFEVSSVGYPLNKGRLGVITPILEWSTERVQ